MKKNKQASKRFNSLLLHRYNGIKRDCAKNKKRAQLYYNKMTILDNIKESNEKYLLDIMKNIGKLEWYIGSDLSNEEKINKCALVLQNISNLKMA